MSGIKDLVKNPLNAIAPIWGASADAASEVKSSLSPNIPTSEDPQIAPEVNSAESKKRRAIAQQRKYASAGRAGTVLSGTGKLG